MLFCCEIRASSAGHSSLQERQRTKCPTSFSKGGPVGRKRNGTPRFSYTSRRLFVRLPPHPRCTDVAKTHTSWTRKSHTAYERAAWSTRMQRTPHYVYNSRRHYPSTGWTIMTHAQRDWTWLWDQRLSECVRKSNWYGSSGALPIR